MEPIRTGIIGFGRVATRHLERMRESGLYEVVSVCDITESRRLAAVEEGLTATEDIDAFLDSDLELVVITTHSSMHYSAALKVAAAGKHMLIEKPLSVRGMEAEEMVQAAIDNGVMLTVHHNRRNDGDYRLVKAAISETLVGDIIAVENRVLGSGPAVGYGVPDYNQEWRISAASGGGTMLDFGPHWVDQILDLMERQTVVSVFADVRHIRWGDADDLFDITMVFDSGVRARASKADMAYCALPYKWLILGTDASLIAVRGEDFCTIHGPDSAERQYTKRVEEVSLHDNIAAHLREGTELVVPACQGLRVMQVIEAARQSGESGRSVDVDI